MLRDSQPAKVSRFSELYEYLIPRDHFLRRFNLNYSYRQLLSANR